MVSLEFEHGQLAFVFGIYILVLNEENLGRSWRNDDFALFVRCEGKGFQGADGGGSSQRGNCQRAGAATQADSIHHQRSTTRIQHQVFPGGIHDGPLDENPVAALRGAADLAYGVCERIGCASRYFRRDIGARQLNRR